MVAHCHSVDKQHHAADHNSKTYLTPRSYHMDPSEWIVIDVLLSLRSVTHLADLFVELLDGVAVIIIIAFTLQLHMHTVSCEYDAYANACLHSMCRMLTSSVSSNIGTMTQYTGVITWLWDACVAKPKAHLFVRTHVLASCVNHMLRTLVAWVHGFKAVYQALLNVKQPHWWEAHSSGDAKRVLAQCVVKMCLFQAFGT
jgi:hypothetical protein